MFAGRPIEVDEGASTVMSHTARSRFWSMSMSGRPGAVPTAMAPMFERAAEELEPKVRLLKLNADSAPSVSPRLGISGIPTLLQRSGDFTNVRRNGYQEHYRLDKSRAEPALMIITYRKDKTS
jgi:thioredoxin 2